MYVTMPKSNTFSLAEKSFHSQNCLLDPSVVWASLLKVATVVWASLLKVATAVKGEAAEKVGSSQYVTSHVRY